MAFIGFFNRSCCWRNAEKSIRVKDANCAQNYSLSSGLHKKSNDA